MVIWRSDLGRGICSDISGQIAGSAILWSQCSVGKIGMLQYKLKIVGVVQEVGFRFFVRQEATRSELVGAVWNCPDGSVEVVLQGEEALLDQLV